MENLCVVTTEQIDSTTLRKFVESHGGRWNPEATLDQGVIEQGGCRILVSVEGCLDLSYEDGELRRLEELLGAPPRTIINIEIGHAKGSRTLAEEFVSDVLARWGGYFDDNTSDLG